MRQDKFFLFSPSNYYPKSRFFDQVNIREVAALCFEVESKFERKIDWSQADISILGLDAENEIEYLEQPYRITVDDVAAAHAFKLSTHPNPQMRYSKKELLDQLQDLQSA